MRRCLGLAGEGEKCVAVNEMQERRVSVTISKKEFHAGAEFHAGERAPRRTETGEKVLIKDVSLKSAPVRARLARNSSCHPHGRQRWRRQEAEGAKSPLNERLTVAIELAAALHYSRGVGPSLRGD